MTDTPEASNTPEGAQNFNASEERGNFLKDTNKASKQNETQQVREKGQPKLRELGETEKQNFAELANDENQMELTRELLKWSGLQPVAEIEVEDRKFLLTKLLKGEGGQRDQIVMYYPSVKTGKLYPRVLYKSKSDGGWRSCPGSDGEGHYSKGLGVHYTQETKPHEDIIKAIEEVETRFPVVETKGLDLIEHYFDYTQSPSSKPEWFTYARETRKYDDQGALSKFQRFPPGYYTQKRYQGTDFTSDFRNFDFTSPELAGFLPDFSQDPERSMEVNHTLLGSTKTEAYPAQLGGRPIEWVMAYDQTGRVWIDRISFKDSWVNSYGVRSEIIDSGALTNKPLDYSFQVSALKPGSEVVNFEADPKYSDLTPLLDNLRPIQEFRKARGVAVERIPAEEPATIENASSFMDLREAIIKTGGLQGTSDYFSSEQLLSLVARVIKGELTINYLTRTGGLRETVAKLLEEKQKAA